MFPVPDDHWDDVMATFDAPVTRPYWSTEIWDTFADDPYAPAVTPLAGKTLVESVPKLTLLALMLESPAPFADTFETEIMEGKSAFTRARNKGGPAEPMDGPAKTWFGGAPVAVPVPPDEILRGVPRVKTSMETPSTTDKAYPGLEVWWIATFPCGSITMASWVWS